MLEDKPRLSADAEGVWREDTPGKRFGILWEEVYVVSGDKLNDMTRIHTVVVLDQDNGHFLELYNDWPGFGEVVAQITERLPGIDPDWFDKVERLEECAQPLLVWQRPQQNLTE